MLVAERNEVPTEPGWSAIEAFLYENVPTPGRRVVIDSHGTRILQAPEMVRQIAYWIAARLIGA